MTDPVAAALIGSGKWLLAMEDESGQVQKYYGPFDTEDEARYGPIGALKGRHPTWTARVLGPSDVSP